jgi:hypothetical protein
MASVLKNEHKFDILLLITATMRVQIDNYLLSIYGLKIASKILQINEPELSFWGI